jgi:hypothetical protein
MQVSGHFNTEEKAINVYWIVRTHSTADLKDLQNQKNKKKDMFHLEKATWFATSGSPLYTPSQSRCKTFRLWHAVVMCEN